MMTINVGRGQDADGRHGMMQMMTEGRRHATTMLLLQGSAQLSLCGVCVFACGYWSCSEREILLGTFGGRSRTTDLCCFCSNGMGFTSVRCNALLELR